MAMGVDRWIDLQLHPEKISDTAIDARLAAFRTLHMSSKEIAEEFPDNQMIKQVMDGKRPMPSDPAKRAVFQVQMARLRREERKKKQRKNESGKAEARRSSGCFSTVHASDTAKTAEELAAAAAASGDATRKRPTIWHDSNSMNSMSMNSTAARAHTKLEFDERQSHAAAGRKSPVDAAEARRREDRLYADLKVQGLIDLPPDQRYKKVMAMSADEQWHSPIRCAAAKRRIFSRA